MEQKSRYDKRPNVLFLCADMIAGKNFGCYGDPVKMTPNVDNLAQQGTVFENAYCACPPCIPARVSMMCGQYARTHGKLAHVRMELNPRPQLIPEILSRHGYNTALVGKTHWWPADDKLGCDQAYITIDGGLTTELRNKDAYIQFLRSKGLFDYNPEGDWDCIECVNRLKPDDIPEEYLKVNWTGDKACEVIEEFNGKDKPFFLFCSFVEPHTHGCVKSELKEKFSDLPVPPAIEDENEFENKPQLQKAYTEEIIENSGGHKRNHDAYRRGVYASLNLVDQNIGKIMDKLDKLGIAENTIIIFTSDHGDLMGDHGMNEKTFLYEGAIRVPMVMKVPGNKKKERREHLVSHVDLLPTILDLCGIDEWKDMPIEGRSMVPVLENPDAEWRDNIYCEVGQTHCRKFNSSMLKMVRNGPWKYVYTLVDGHIADEELYNLEEDPDELHNLTQSHPDKTCELRNELMRWMVATEANRIRPVPENEKWNTKPYPVPNIDRKYF